jgi:uncharacterized protein (DUF433 family)
MAGLDWSQCLAVESIPGKVSGAWVFRGTRMPVATVFENLEDGMTVDELIETFDGLTREQIQISGIRCTQPGSAGTSAVMRILFDQGTPVPIRRFPAKPPN